MAKDILVMESLSSSMIKAGLKLIERLDAENAQVTSAFWFYIAEDKAWQLIIVSPLVALLGPREYYRKVVNANNAALDEEEVISLHDITVANTTHEIAQLFKYAISSGNRIPGTRFSRNTINGSFIEDSYIYRSN